LVLDRFDDMRLRILLRLFHRGELPVTGIAADLLICSHIDLIKGVVLMDGLNYIGYSQYYLGGLARCHHGPGNLCPRKSQKGYRGLPLGRCREAINNGQG